jgi:hypothetical protein
VLPWETLRARDDRRARRRTARPALEDLEGRQLLSYTSLGYSLPDLRVTGQGGPVAAWGAAYQVTVTLQNTGASTIIEPLAMVPPSQLATAPDGSEVPPYAIPSSADAASVPIEIFINRNPRTVKGAVQIGTVTAPALSQNNAEQFAASLTLPSRPAGFPNTGIFYIHLVANANQAVLQTSYAHNVSPAIPVRFISQTLPQLTVTALDVPPVMQPGDTITPTFQVANLGTASTAAQGPVEVALVASTTPDFNLGSSIVALYTLPQAIPGSSTVPVRASARHHRRRLSGANAAFNNVTPGANVERFTGSAVTLPVSPSTYFLGIVVDPNNKLTQLSLPANRLEQIRPVGPPVPGLPPAGVVSSPLVLPFPNPPDGVAIGNVNPATL